MLVGSATRDGVTVVSVVLGEPSEAARDADTLALLRYGLRATTRRTVAAPAARRSAAADLQVPRRRRSRLVAARAVARVVRRGERAPRRASSARRTSSRGRCPRGARVGHASSSRVRGKVVARVPLVTAAARGRRPTLERRALGIDAARQPGSILLVAAAGGLYRAARAARAGACVADDGGEQSA